MKLQKVIAKKLPRQFRLIALLILCLVSLITSLISLRNNNQQMIQLRAAVFEADEKDGDIESALKELREFVFNHMNTNLSSGANAVKPPIQLKYRYERLAAIEKAKFEEANRKMLDQAESVCVAQFPGSVFSQSRLDCAKNFAAANPVTQNSIPDDLYKFDFVSPRWSPDLAGWSFVTTIILFVLFLMQAASDILIKRNIKQSL